MRRWAKKAGRFWALSPGDKWLFLLAVYWLGVARLWLSFVPFPRLAERLGSANQSGEANADVLQRVSRAISSAAANVPWRADCFPQAIATHKLLKRCKLSSSIHLGVDLSGDAELLAHAWVTCGGIVVIGEFELDRYAEIHRLGA